MYFFTGHNKILSNVHLGIKEVAQQEVSEIRVSSFMRHSFQVYFLMKWVC